MVMECYLLLFRSHNYTAAVDNRAVLLAWFLNRAHTWPARGKKAIASFDMCRRCPRLQGFAACYYTHTQYVNMRLSFRYTSCMCDIQANLCSENNKLYVFHIGIVSKIASWQVHFLARSCRFGLQWQVAEESLGAQGPGAKRLSRWPTWSVRVESAALSA